MNKAREVLYLCQQIILPDLKLQDLWAPLAFSSFSQELGIYLFLIIFYGFAYGFNKNSNMVKSLLRTSFVDMIIGLWQDPWPKQVNSFQMSLNLHHHFSYFNIILFFLGLVLNKLYEIKMI